MCLVNRYNSKRMELNQSYHSREKFALKIDFLSRTFHSAAAGCGTNQVNFHTRRIDRSYFVSYEFIGFMGFISQFNCT